MTGIPADYSGRDCCSTREDTDGKCECSASGEACWNTDEYCCPGLTCTAGFGTFGYDIGHYGICL